VSALATLFILVTIVVVAVAIARNRAKRRDALQMVVELLGGQALSDDVSVSGSFEHVATAVRFGTRGSGKSAQSWTYVDCQLPAGYPLSLHLRRHRWLDDGKIERGEMVDVQIGDPSFDGAFLVEGAPAEVVRRLLVAEVRAYLQAHDRVDVETRDQGWIRLAVHGWLYDRAALLEALRVASRLALGLRDASLADQPDRTPLAAAGAPYREIADDGAVQQARAAQADEVRGLDAIRTRRNQQQWGVLGAIVFFGAVLIWMLLLARCDG
jgi:hypothetical protein